MGKTLALASVFSALWGNIFMKYLDIRLLTPNQYYVKVGEKV